MDDAQELEPPPPRHRQGRMDPGRGQSALHRHLAQPADGRRPHLYEDVYCARGDMENRIKECQIDLFADRTSAATMRANQLRLWFASMAYVLLCALRRIGLAGTQLRQGDLRHHPAQALSRSAPWSRTSVRRVKIAMASGCPYQLRVPGRPTPCSQRPPADETDSAQSIAPTKPPTAPPHPTAPPSRAPALS